jgi:hypothetical protein
MDKVILFIVIGIFIFFISMGLFKSLFELIRRRSFVKTKAKIIDKVEQYSEEWGKYYPEMYEKKEKVYGKINKIEEKMAQVESVRSKIPISMNKDGITVHMGKEEERVVESYEEENEEPVFICEYEVDGKKYYYDDPCGNRRSLKSHLGEEVDVLYDAKKPSYVLAPKQSIRTLLICLVMDILFIVILAAILLD